MLGGLGKFKELRDRLIFVILALIVFRIGTFIPVPGVNPEAMMSLFEAQEGIVDMFNMFSGGALSRFSIFALNVMPYISAAIIVQLLGQVYEPWKALKKEGEAGRRKLTQYSRYGAVFLAIIQAASIATALQGQTAGGAPVVFNPGFGFVFTAIVSLTAGTIFLMWLGEQITERGVGNGISLIIFAGIVASLPGALINTMRQVNAGEISWVAILVIAVLVLSVVYFVVFVERGQRRITVNYARRQGARQAYQNQSSHLPLKLNMAGVIPPIFASSLILLPATLTHWTGGQGATAAAAAVDPTWQTHFAAFLQKIATALAPNEPLHMLLYAALIMGFAFFYTALVFNSQETADNLKKSGALVPGIRPGKATGDYIEGVLTRLTMIGSLYLVAVCLLPEVLRATWQVPFFFGGTSLLIVVIVVMDFTSQIQAHLYSHQYDSLLKKANLKGGPRGGLARG
ncbi:preprotein translocase subunit SecY [Silanimonas sp.]|uniref:preprotein translocase subunit SecY n=1 Tax=Silanimonas sp. TaxID=1929290 RepID=UPI001BBB53DF|nr:preprotein translocase subunit SecY [Silanimonas sp.]MBS3895487.1 preprotein translocase subunit SecY [Silanimonas sp.]